MSAVGSRLSGELSADSPPLWELTARWAPGLDRAVPLVAVTGALLRLLEYAWPRSIHLDEVAVLLNVQGRSWAELAGPLDLGQTAAIGYLVLEKAWIGAFGTGEYALRALPLALSLASVPLFAALARRLLLPAGALAAVAVFALAPPLIFDAAQAKPYAGDVLFATLLVLCAARWFRWPPGWRGALAWAGVGALAPWLSQPAVFVALAVGAVLFLGVRTWPVRVAVAVWAGSAAGAALWATAHMSIETLAFMQGFWQPGFPRPGAAGLASFLLFWVPFRLLYQVVGWPPEGALVLYPVLVVGAVALYRRGWGALALVTAPVVMAIGAAVGGVYPFGGQGPWLAGRVVVFLAPMVALLLGSTVAWLWARPRWRHLLRPLALALPAGLLVPLARDFPYRAEEVGPALEAVAREAGPADQLYVGYGAYLPYRYYEARLGLDRLRTVIGRCARAEPWRYVDELRRLRPGPVWIVSSNTFPAEDALLEDFLARNGRVVARDSFPGTMLLHGVLTGGDQAPDPRLVERPPAHHYRDCRGIWSASAAR